MVFHYHLLQKKTISNVDLIGEFMLTICPDAEIYFLTKAISFERFRDT